MFAMGKSGPPHPPQPCPLPIIPFELPSTPRGFFPRPRPAFLAMEYTEIGAHSPFAMRSLNGDETTALRAGSCCGYHQSACQNQRLHDGHTV